MKLPLMEVIFFCGATWRLKQKETAKIPKLLDVALSIKLFLQAEGTRKVEPNSNVKTLLRLQILPFTTKPPFLLMKATHKAEPLHLQFGSSQAVMVL